MHTEMDFLILVELTLLTELINVVKNVVQQGRNRKRIPTRDLTSLSRDQESRVKS